MPPPPKNGIRKTLAERAGETAKPAPIPLSSRTASAAVKGVPLADTARQTSFSSSVSSMRPPSVTSMRNVSNNSFSSSVSAASRLPSSQFCRPQTALGNSRIQKPVPNSIRPSTAMETHNLGPNSKKRKGMTNFPLDINGAPKPPAQMQRNGSYDPSMKYTSGWASTLHKARSFRDISLSTAMSRMSLDDPAPKTAPGAKPELPVTPSQIPRLAQPPTQQLEAPSPSRSPKKKAQAMQFLTRDSNTLAAWDSDSRLEEIIENHMAVFKESLSGATSESNSLKDMVNMYKARSKSTMPQIRKLCTDGFYA